MGRLSTQFGMQPGYSRCVRWRPPMCRPSDQVLLGCQACSCTLRLEQVVPWEIGCVNVCTVMGGCRLMYCAADEGSTNGMPPTVATLLASTDAADTGDFAVCDSPSPDAAGHPCASGRLHCGLTRVVSTACLAYAACAAAW